MIEFFKKDMKQKPVIFQAVKASSHLKKDLLSLFITHLWCPHFHLFKQASTPLLFNLVFV